MMGLKSLTVFSFAHLRYGCLCLLQLFVYHFLQLFDVLVYSDVISIAALAVNVLQEQS